MREIEILMIKRDYQGKVKEHIDKNQRDYILREELKVIREELGDDAGAEDADGYLEQLEKLNADKETKEKIKKEIQRFKGMPAEARRQMSCAPISRRSSRCRGRRRPGTIRTSSMRRKCWRKITMVWSR